MPREGNIRLARKFYLIRSAFRTNGSWTDDHSFAASLHSHVSKTIPCAYMDWPGLCGNFSNFSILDCGGFCEVGLVASPRACKVYVGFGQNLCSIESYTSSEIFKTPVPS